MLLDFEIKKTAYIDFLKYYYFKRNLTPKLLVYLGLTLLLSYNMNRGMRHFQSQFLLTFLVIGCIFFSFFFLIPYLIAANKISKLFITENINYQLLETDEGIKLIAATFERFIKWEEIKSINDEGNYIYFILFNARIILVPKTAFIFTNAKTVFFKRIENEILLARHKSPNRLYAKGWYGLIPLIGAFVGLWLIGQGLSKYKDRKLILIGVAAILFTVLVYSSIFYMGRKYNQGNRDLYISTRQMYMNSLVRNIEFYKVQNSQYPDSLPQLLIQVKNNTTHPPLFYTKESSLNAQLYYRKIHEHYTLFFSGADRIPYTGDDVFPLINDLDIPTGFVKFK